MIKLGMLSAAHVHAPGYAACLKQIPGVTFAGVWDDNPERGRQFATTHGTRFFENVSALMDEELDGVIICSENLLHRPLTELAVRHTRHILCEKPIATTIEDAREMIELCATSAVKLQIAFPMRFSPPVRSLKQLLAEEVVGRVWSLKTTNHGAMPSGWFTDPVLAGGGAVMDHTVHIVDLLRWFWGAEVTEVYAEVGSGLLHPGLGIDDAGILSFKLSTGAYGTLDTSWSRLQSFPTWGDVTIEVVGEKGVARLDAFKQQLAVYSNQATRAQWIHWGTNSDLLMIRDFVEMIVENRAPSITGEDGLKALEVALAAYRSAETGRAVQL